MTARRFCAHSMHDSLSDNQPGEIRQLEDLQVILGDRAVGDQVVCDTVTRQTIHGGLCDGKEGDSIRKYLYTSPTTQHCIITNTGVRSY